MILSLIVAVAANGTIGKDNHLPWHIPADLKHFKELTLGKPVVMGRKTFESIGKPLPGRRNLAISRNPAWRAAGVEVFPSLDDALAHAADAAEVMVIGGSALFAAALPVAQRLYLTEIHRAFDGDVVFPPLDRAQWRELSRDRRDGDPAFSFVSLEKIS
jgi:dihydrofolate reductase